MPPPPTLTCEKSRIGQKCKVRKAASIILHVSLLYPQENNTINALNTMEKRERSFSALKFINNYLRSTVTDERLNGLALLFVHPDITLEYDAVIDDFGKSNRRFQFS